MAHAGIKLKDLPQLFKPTGGSFSGVLFFIDNGVLRSFDVTSIFSPDERRKIGNAGAQATEALRRLDISLKDIPQVLIPDINTAIARGGGTQEGLASAFKDFSGSGRGGEVTAVGAGALQNIKGADPTITKTIQKGTLGPTPSALGVDTTTPDLAQFGEFTRQLQFGDSGEDVKRLQQFLNASGFDVGKEGTAGSPGNETEFFGPKTQKALQKFQKSQGIVSTGDPQTTGFGRFGPQTMQSVNTFSAPPTPTEPTIGAPTGDIGAPIGTPQEVDFSSLEASEEFKGLSADEQEALKAVFSAIANNDQEAAQRLEASFKAASKIADPFFAQQLRLVSDAAQRGFVSIDQEEEFKEEQLRNSIQDLRNDIANKREFLSLDEINVLRGIERQFNVALETTRQNLAATGFTRSSRRAAKEQLLQEERADIVESQKRGFAFQQEEARLGLERGERDIALDVARLQELTQEGRLDLLRTAEEQLGTENLAGLTGIPGLAPLGGIVGTIEQEKQRDIISGAINLAF